MAVTMMEHVYGFTGTGKRVRMGHVKETEPDLYPVGGTIFYIDPNSDREVEFFDQYGDMIANVSVGDKPFAYKVLNVGQSGLDKYYVYQDKLYNTLRWTYYENGAYVYNSLGTKTGIGEGKKNTQIVMSADSGKYITNNSDGYPTIWYALNQANINKEEGCDDWFVPSKDEIEALRSAIGYQVVPDTDSPVILSAGAVTGGIIAGTADGQAHYRDYNGNRTCYPSATKFLDSYIWESSEYSSTGAWFWYYSRQSQGNYSKYGYFSVVFVRAF